MASGAEEKFAEKSSLEPERSFGMHILLLDRMQFMPESEAARDDQSNQKADQEEPSISRKRDQQNRDDSDRDDETRRSSQAESSQAESRAAAGFRFHKFYSTADSQTLSDGWRVSYLAEKRASEGLRSCVIITPFLDVYWMGITQYRNAPPPHHHQFPATI